MEKTITLPIEMMQWVINVLAEQPFKLAAPVLNHIQPQLERQNGAASAQSVHQE